jgi:hypothetical protein
VAVLKDTLGNTLSSTNIKATESEDIQAPDATINLRDTDNTIKDTFSELSGGTENYELGDLQVEVEDEDLNPILAIDYLAYSTNQLDLTILSQCAVIIGLNTNVIISETEPAMPDEGDVWLEPI